MLQKEIQVQLLNILRYIHKTVIEKKPFNQYQLSYVKIKIDYQFNVYL